MMLQAVFCFQIKISPLVDGVSRTLINIPAVISPGTLSELLHNAEANVRNWTENGDIIINFDGVKSTNRKLYLLTGIESKDVDVLFVSNLSSGFWDKPSFQRESNEPAGILPWLWGGRK